MLGILDSGYLTYEHYQNTIPPCTPSIFIDCGKVLRSQYSKILGIPLALFGFVHYLILTATIYYSFKTRKRWAKYAVIILSTFGFLFSLYLMYLQLFVIGSICLYCTLSALIISCHAPVAKHGNRSVSSSGVQTS